MKQQHTAICVIRNSKTINHKIIVLPCSNRVGISWKLVSESILKHRIRTQSSFVGSSGWRRYTACTPIDIVHYSRIRYTCKFGVLRLAIGEMGIQRVTGKVYVLENRVRVQSAGSLI